MTYSSKEIESFIYCIRGHKVMLDYDLASLYGVETKALNQSVKRNLSLFPKDFMFQLTDIEQENIRSQFVTGSKTHTNLRYRPFAFTELGIAMLSGVLKSERVIQVHISIIRVFFQMRKLLKSEQNFVVQLRNLEDNSNRLFKIVFGRTDALEVKEIQVSPKRRIGF